jgi:hypothetical protein
MNRETPDLAAIVERDRLGPTGAINTYGLMASSDRKVLLDLLREARESFLNVEWNAELRCPWCDQTRPRHRYGCTQADLMGRLAALGDSLPTNGADR